MFKQSTGTYNFLRLLSILALFTCNQCSFFRRNTIGKVLKKYQEPVSKKLSPLFKKKGLPFPTKSLEILVFKKEAKVELWTQKQDQLQYIKSYAMTTNSGVSGPKLREGDRQIPEGFYSVVGLNPNSRFHLSMKIDYPNRFDLEMAKKEGRENPGTNIFIHGKAASIGCVAIGDRNIEELFVLTALTGKDNVKVKIYPNDIRGGGTFTKCKVCPDWLPTLYEKLVEDQLRYK